MKNVRFKNSKRAFTIVELVIVIAVISILAAVLIPTFAFMIKRAEESRDLQESENQAKQDFADSMLGDNEQSSSEQTPEETEPEETTPERIGRDESELVHVKVVPVIDGDSVSFDLIYYMNRNEDTADIIDTVLKDATITARFSSNFLIGEEMISETVTLFEYGANGFSEDCFTPQAVTLATDYLNNFPEQGGFSLTIRAAWPDNRYNDFLERSNAGIISTYPYFTKTNGEFLFVEAPESSESYTYEGGVEMIYKKLNATESEP